jgi:hypothetical protein
MRVVSLLRRPLRRADVRPGHRAGPDADPRALLVEVCASPEHGRHLAREWKWRLRRRGWWEPRVEAGLH